MVDHVIQGVEELSVKKKRGPTERAGPAEKKPRVASASSFEGGRGAGGRGGRGRGGYRQFSSYSSY